MRAAIYVVLVGLAVTAFVLGSFSIALTIGAVKAGLVGFEYMELRDAHPAHRAGFVLGLAAIAAGLLLIA